MGHGKLRKFKENETFSCLIQPLTEDIIDVSQGRDSLVLRDYPIKGNWGRDVFHNDKPIVLELGCGRGEYTIDLASRDSSCNYIGVDIKGARLWKGAKFATENNLSNVAFLRTRIEFIEAFFAPGEISEIWLTFSDPQLKSENSRLTSPRFIQRYSNFLKPGGIVRLKTDSMFLYQYSKSMALENELKILAASEDLYGPDKERLIQQGQSPSLFEVQTYYERMFLDMGLKITYLSFVLDSSGPFRSPSSFDPQYWREIEGTRRSFGHKRG